MARANFRVILTDFDKFETHNLGGQFVKLNQVGQYKVHAVAQSVTEFTSNSITAVPDRIIATTPSHEFMCSAFDNMEARKTMFHVWKKSWNSMNKPLLIDGRLNMEHFQIFCVTPETADAYERDHLFDDSEVEDAVCSLKQTSHAAMMIAGFMTSFFTNHIANIKLREELRTVPFMYEYFIPMNLTEGL